LAYFPDTPPPPRQKKIKDKLLSPEDSYIKSCVQREKLKILRVTTCDHDWLWMLQFFLHEMEETGISEMHSVLVICS
jgi:hypothetical protein